MTIKLSTPLTLALRDEYPGCLPDTESASDLIEAVLWQWLSQNRTARRLVAEHTPVPAGKMAPDHT